MSFIDYNHKKERLVRKCVAKWEKLSKKYALVRIHELWTENMDQNSIEMITRKDLVLILVRFKLMLNWLRVSGAGN